MLWTLDPQLLDAITVSLQCSLSATALAVILGTPLGMLLGRRQFLGRRALLVAAHTGMALPTVLIGLLFYALLSSRGPLGPLGLLYTRKAIILAELALGLPIIVALYAASANAVSSQLERTARTLGASRLRVFWTVLRETRVGLLAATMSTFGRLVSELGIAMMVGGNIRHYTRTMTTAIALETAGGQFALAVALGLILLAVALVVNAAAQALGLGRRWRADRVL